MRQYRKKQNSRIFLKKHLTNTAECDILYKSSWVRCKTIWKKFRKSFFEKFEKRLDKHKKVWYNKQVTEQQMTKWNIGVSPSGKAADSDSVIPRVQILPPQPNENQMQCIWFFVFQVSYWDVDSCPCEIGIWKRKSVSANGMFSGYAFWF